ncbi:MAG: glycosyltransferase family 2 protein [Candidatus Omnitrophota bacterium]
MESKIKSDLLSLTFVIPVLNASQHLACCLKSIRDQDYPKEKVEIFIVDGGSTDTTIEIATEFGAKVLHNEKRLAEYGVQLGVGEATSDLLVVFAADNELVGRDWAAKVVDVFRIYKDVSAVWGRLASGRYDPFLNKYFELVQSDPLNWFLNQNLTYYRAKSLNTRAEFFKFDVDPLKPLVWGANGLTYRTKCIKSIWQQSGYLGDNDAFQSMIERGDRQVVYFNTPFVYHHHVAALGDWINKWKRNFFCHLTDKHQTRNMNWVFVKGFKKKVFIWSIYCIIPIFSLSDSLLRAFRDRNLFWLCHPFVSLTQFLTYVYLVMMTQKGRRFIMSKLFKFA